MLLESLLSYLRELTTIPETTALLPNYPNPFNPETWIPYQLANAADVTLTIYDMRGVAVRQLMLGHQPAGCLSRAVGVRRIGMVEINRANLLRVVSISIRSPRAISQRHAEDC